MEVGRNSCWNQHRQRYSSGNSSSFPKYLTNVNGTLFCSADDGVNGRELWSSNGTLAGTNIVKDIRSGKRSTYLENLTNVNGTLFFSANDGVNGTELWSSDGTLAGTNIVKDIRSGQYYSSPQFLTNVNGTLFFSAYDDANGRELWSSNGTAAGTTLVKDISPVSSGSYPNSSYPGNLTNVNGTLFYMANDGTNGFELWSSNGTLAGTTLVKDIFPGSSGTYPNSSYPAYLTNVNGTLFFSANDGTNGFELWSSNGTTAGTNKVKEKHPGTGGSLHYLTNVNGTLFYMANDGTNGYELWSSNGTPTGTKMVSDINPGAGSSDLSSLTNVNGTLFFGANDGISGAELWVLHPEGAESLDASLIGGDLVITDTDVVGKNNQITISRTDNILIITDANEQFTSAPLGGTLSPDKKTLSFDVTVTPISTLTLNGALGNDTVTVDLSTGNPIPSGGLTFSGGSPTSGPGDMLVITGGTTTSQTFNFTNEHDGSVVLAGDIAGTINYTGLEPVSSTVNAANVILNYSTVTEIISVTQDATDTTLTKVDSDVGGESVAFTNPTNSLQINGGDIGNDTINITNFGTSSGGFKASLTIDGGTGTDTVNLNAVTNLGTGKNLAVSAETINVNAAQTASVSGAINLSAGQNVVVNANVTGGSGGVSILGQGLAALNTIGVMIQGGAVVTTTGSGIVSVTGTGGNSSYTSWGVFIRENSLVTSGGSGSVSVLGIGNTGTDSNLGIYIHNSQINSGGGDVTVTGLGNGNAPVENYGVLVASSARVSSGGSGTVTVMGTGGAGAAPSNYGVDVVYGAVVTSGGGNITVTGIEGSGPSAVALNVGDSGTITTAANGGSVTLIGNSMNFAATASINAQAASSVTLRPRTNGVAINLGTSGDPSSGPLNLTDAELDRFNAGTINIGDATSGAITVSATLTQPGKNLTLITGAGVGGSGDIINGSASTTTLTVNQAGISTYGGLLGGPSSGTANDKNLAFTKSDMGTLTLSGANTFTGATLVSQGILAITNAAALGSSAAGTTVASGATLQLSNNIHVAVEPLTINGVGVSGIGAMNSLSGSNTWGGAITLGSTATMSHSAGNVTVGGTITTAGFELTYDTQNTSEIASLNGSISGAGSLRIIGTGEVNLGAGNSYSGVTTVQQGRLSVQPGTATLGDGTTGTVVMSGATLFLFKSVSENLTISGNGFVFGALSISNGATLSGTITLAGNARISSSHMGNITLGGVISDGGSGFGIEFVSGFPTLQTILSAANTYTGVTTVSGGTVLINGSLANGPEATDVTVASGATLGGTGIINGAVQVNSGGTLSPGNSPGILNTGNTTFESGSTFQVEINGPSVGTQYDQLNVTGAVVVNHSNLNVTLGYSPANGDSFVVVNNDSSDAVTVTAPFKVGGVAVPEGGSFIAGGNRFVITYAGGSNSNDVVVTVQNFTTELKLDGSGNLVVTDIAGGGQNDTLTIKSNTTTGKFEISDPNRILGITGIITGAMVSVDLHTVTVPFTSVSSNVLVNTLVGNDSLTIDLSSGNFGKTVIFDGGTQTSSDSLTLNGGATFANVTHNLTNASSGTVDVTGNSQFSYLGVEPIFDNLSATDRVFTFSSGSDVITVTDGTASDGKNMIDSTLSESVYFVNPTSSLTINARAGDDVVTFTSVDAGYNAAITINGDADSDTVNLAAAINFAADKNLTVAAETIIVNAVQRLSGAGAVNLTADQSIVVNANLTGGTGGTTLLAQGLAALNTVGVTVQNGAVISSTDSGTVSVTGTGGSGSGSFNNGVAVASNSSISSGGGNVQITGTGRGSGSAANNAGVFVDSWGKLTAAGTGTLTVIGTGGATSGGSNYGVSVAELNSAITSQGGAVSVTGNGGGALGGIGGNFGVRVWESAQLTAGGAGAVTVSGTGGLGNGGSNWGVYVAQAAAKITSSGGSVSVTGTGGGSGTSFSNHGVFVSDSGQILAGALGAVSVSGTGGTASGGYNNGVAVASNSSISSSGGSIEVRGTAGAGSSSLGVSVVSLGQVLATSGAPTVAIIADSMDLASASSINAGGNHVSLRPLKSSIFINLGSTTDVAVNTLELSDAELDRITAGAIRIGDSTSGDITISSAISLLGANTLQLLAGGAILDGQATGTDLDVANLVMSTATGIGTALNPLETAITTLQASGGSGGVFVANTGSLTLVGSGVTADGHIVVTVGSPLNVQASVLSRLGNVRLSAGESAGAGDNLTVASGITIASQTGNVTLQAGDVVNLAAGSVVNSPMGTIVAQVGFNDTDGISVGSIAGALISPRPMIVQGGNASDSITVYASASVADIEIKGGNGDDVIVVQTSTGLGVRIDGEGGSDSFVIQLGALAGPVKVTDTAGSNTVRIVGTPGDDDLTVTATQVSAGSETITLNVVGSTSTSLVIDGGGGTNQVTVESTPVGTTVTGSNVAATLSSISAPLSPTALNTPIVASASFIDLDVGDIHTAIWDWGDGSTSTGTVTETSSLMGTNGSVRDSHNYASAGVYTVKLTVIDNAGKSKPAVFQYVVIYDPNAGFVTGGGWINSPAGAYVNTSLTGKATFGFNSKYNKGATVPTGNTEFRFNVANFNFKSTSYEWLVVSGAKARFRGVGTVNGAGSYGFELTAWDGQVSGGGGTDRFRIKIWNQNQGNGIVYDNMLGVSDGADPTTALGGGSIVIHNAGRPLLASGGVAIGSGKGSLTEETLIQAVDQAINYWRSTGIEAEEISNLQQINVQIADLTGDELGIASDTDYVWIDRGAAGYGWQLDTLGTYIPTASGGMDLLSVVAHELGHKLGLEHSHDDSDVMAPTLHVGVRTLVGNLGQPLGYFSTNSVLSDNLNSDVVRLSSRDTKRLFKEDSEELHAHDQLFASLDAGPVTPGLRQAIVANKSFSDAKQKPTSEAEDTLEQDFMEAIVLAHLAARS